MKCYNFCYLFCISLPQGVPGTGEELAGIVWGPAPREASEMWIETASRTRHENRKQIVSDSLVQRVGVREGGRQGEGVVWSGSQVIESHL